MNHFEDKLQITCITWFDYQYPKIKKLLHASPNGGFRNKIEASKFKAMGTRAGFPDLFLAVPNKYYHGLFIELKVGKNGQTDNQIEYQKLVEYQGYKYELVRTFSAFHEAVEDYLKSA